jgi:hypothetical protein
MTMEPNQSSVQKKPEKPARTKRKKRTAEQKYGFRKVLKRRLSRIEKTQKEELSLLRVIGQSLAPFLEIESDELRAIVCTDEVDEAIGRLLVRALKDYVDKGILIDSAVDIEKPKLLSYSSKVLVNKNSVKKELEQLETELES